MIDTIHTWFSPSEPNGGPITKKSPVSPICMAKRGQSNKPIGQHQISQYVINRSSTIRTVPSALDFHQISPRPIKSRGVAGSLLHLLPIVQGKLLTDHRRLGISPTPKII